MNILGVVTANNNGKTGKSFYSTIPKKLVLKFGLKKGDAIVFCENDAGDVIVKKNGVHR